MNQRVTLIAFVLFALSCDTSEPPTGGEPSVQFTAVDASCTEVWLQVKLSPGVLPSAIRIQRDSTTILKTTITVSETLIVDEGLFPNKTYSYALSRSATFGEERVNLSTTTLDTTSHEFTWQIDTLGDGVGSVLYDVAIINDTLAYAVGEIGVRDSLGNWVNPPYNMAKWNGRCWELMRLLYDCRLYYPNCGPSFYLYTPIRSILAFGPNDIWVAAGTAQHYDGAQWTEYAGIQGVGGAYKIWGSSSNDLWFVGYDGFIVHRSNALWRRVESGTTTDINDVWGNTQETILCGVSNRYSSGDRKLLQLKSDLTVRPIEWLPQTRISTVWFAYRSKLFIGGSGLIVGNSNRWREVLDLPLYFSTRIRGNQVNDVFVVGAFGLCGHFNGTTWHSYPEGELSGGSYEGLAVSSSWVVAVGDAGGKAIILRGNRPSLSH